MVESFLKGGILLFSKESIIKVLRSFEGVGEVQAGLLGGFGGGVCQVVVMGPCTFLVTAAGQSIGGCVRSYTHMTHTTNYPLPSPSLPSYQSLATSLCPCCGASLRPSRPRASRASTTAARPWCSGRGPTGPVDRGSRTCSAGSSERGTTPARTIGPPN